MAESDVEGYDPLDTSPGGAYEQGGEIILLYGISRSGKTHMAKFLVWLWVKQKKLFNHVFAFNGGPSRSLEEILRPELIAPIDIDTFVKFITVAEKLGKKKERTLLILDDIGGCRGIFEKPKLKSFWTTYRHYGVTILVCSQMYTQIPKDLRAQVNVWMVMSQPLDDDELIKSLSGYAKQGQTTKFKELLMMISLPENQYTALVSDVERRGFHLLKAPVGLPKFRL